MKIGGYIIVDGQEVAETAQCCHCGNHFTIRHGSGTVRGYCVKCNQVTCGAEGCHVCIPFEKKMELYEQGKLSIL